MLSINHSFSNFEDTLTHFHHILIIFIYYIYIILLLLSLLSLLLFTIIVESRKNEEKKVGRLWEAPEAPPQSIPIESKILKKVWGEASASSASLISTIASHSLPDLYYI